MSRPRFGRRIPLVTYGIIESAVAPGPFWKIRKRVLVKELEIVVEEFRRELSNLNFYCASHISLIFL
jgi:hypothetical protein